jgi:energy-coupling factor transport system ATP-binding protein
VAGGILNLFLNHLQITRQDFSLTAHGTFRRGIHLVSGIVGSGKSSLALCMAGVLPQKSGAIVRSGIMSTMLSLQFPEYHVTGRTIWEECTSWGCRPDEILKSCRLTERAESIPLALSRGELKRLELACILNKSYDLLLLDEPFSSLDCNEKQEFCKLIPQKKNGIVIIFTHEQEVLPKVDFIWEIVSGNLHELGTMPDAIESWSGAPGIIKKLILCGKSPCNISIDDIVEAACRI